MNEAKRKREGEGVSYGHYELHPLPHWDATHPPSFSFFPPPPSFPSAINKKRRMKRGGKKRRRKGEGVIPPSSSVPCSHMWSWKPGFNETILLFTESCLHSYCSIFVCVFRKLDPSNLVFFFRQTFPDSDPSPSSTHVSLGREERKRRRQKYRSSRSVNPFPLYNRGRPTAELANFDKNRKGGEKKKGRKESVDSWLLCPFFASSCRFPARFFPYPETCGVRVCVCQQSIVAFSFLAKLSFRIHPLPLSTMH